MIWATTILTEEKVSECKDVDEGIERFYWVVVAMVVFGYVMVFADILICLVSTCLFGFFICYYFAAYAHDQRARPIAHL